MLEEYVLIFLVGVVVSDGTFRSLETNHEDLKLVILIV